MESPSPFKGRRLSIMLWYIDNPSVFEKGQEDLFRPTTDIQRAYPNILNFEGVKGLENSKCPEEKTCYRPYLRQLAGPMDYTPSLVFWTYPWSAIHQKWDTCTSFKPQQKWQEQEYL